MRLDARTAPIHAVLEDHLEPKHLAYALRLWSDHFIDQPNLSLKEYVERFYTRQPISMRSHELYNLLLPAMMEAFKARMKFKGELIEPYDFPDYDLDDTNIILEEIRQSIPSSETPESHSKPAVEIAPDTVQQEPLKEVVTNEVIAEIPRIERYEIFSLFIRTLCNKVSKDRREKLFKVYASEIQGCCIFPVGKHFFEWLVGDTNYFEDESLSLEDMSNITHTLYMGMCDYIGPVEADNALSYSANTVANQFPNAEFDINNLL